MKYEATFSDRELMLALKESPNGCRCTDLANFFKVTRQAMHYRLRNLERQRMITREVGDREKRQPDYWKLPQAS